MFEELIKVESTKDYYNRLIEFIDLEYSKYEIYPAKQNIFEAFKLTPLEEVKVVVLGQDPYHGENEAHGLAFSVNKGVKLPPSLKNIYKELQNEFGYDIPNHGCLESLAKQGVLFLNSVLTVKKDKPASHKNKGWEIFTDNVISYLNNNDEPIVFMLWGNYAKEKEKLITNEKHLILKSVHPSPFSARNGFFGCNHFKEANRFLVNNNIQEINWKIENI